MSQIHPTKGIGVRPRVEVRGRDLKKSRFERQNFSLIVRACSIHVMCAVYLGISIDLLAKINLHYNACQFFFWTILSFISSFTVRAPRCGGLPSLLSGSVLVIICTFFCRPSDYHPAPCYLNGNKVFLKVYHNCL